MREMKDSGIEWVGAIPAAWGVHRIASHFQEIKEKNTANAYSNALQFKMGKIIAKPQKWDEDETNETYSAYTVVHPNTIMINGLNLEFDFVTQRVARVECNGIITSAYIALSPRDDINAEYICYLLKSYDACRAFHSMGRGLRKILSYSELKNKPIVVPPLAEQERIAAFLDAECAEIDAVLEKTRASIEEYKKLKQAVITQAVTKGIRGDRPMKNSGIEWIGEIPAEWDVIRNAFLYKEKSRLPEENAVSLSLSQVDGLIATDDMKERSLKTSTYDGWKQVRTNDLVLNRFKGHLGVLFAANIEGMVSFHYGVYEPLRQFDSKFFEYLYHSDAYKAILGLKSNGMTIGLQNLSNQNFYSVYSLYPPEEEQQEIIQYLDDKCSGIDALIVQKQEHFTEIENYKKSLIYEYVTGKKEVKTSVLAD